MTSGPLTARAARDLAQQLEPLYRVLCGHGTRDLDPPQRLGEIVSWYGDSYGLAARLALLDVAVVETDSDRVLLLAEIEESTSVPKTVLGDVFATLLGSHVTFQGQRHLAVGAWTTLLVLVKGGNTSQAQLAHLQAEVNRLRPHLRTPNAATGRIVLATYTHGSQISGLLASQATEALGRG